MDNLIYKLNVLRHELLNRIKAAPALHPSDEPDVPLEPVHRVPSEEQATASKRVARMLHRSRLLRGPSNLHVLKHLGRTIFLFGENHTRSNMCSEEEGELIDDVLVRIMTEIRHVDIFYEDDILLVKRPRSARPRQHNTLFGIKKSGRLADDSRVHFVDVRDEIHTVFFYETSTNMNNPLSHLNAFVNNMLMTEKHILNLQYRRTVCGLIKEVLISPIFRNALYWDKHINDMYDMSPLLMKQFMKSDIGAEALLACMFNFREMHQDLHVLLNQFLNVLDESLVNLKRIYAQIVGVVTEMHVWLMDTYALARMFKPYTSCVIFYGGSCHTRNIRDSLLLAGATIVTEDFSVDPNTNIQGDIHRCKEIEKHRRDYVQITAEDLVDIKSQVSS